MDYGLINAKMPVYLYGDEYLEGSIRITSMPPDNKLFTIQQLRNGIWVDVFTIDGDGNIIGQIGDFAFVNEPNKDGKVYGRRNSELGDPSWEVALAAANNLSDIINVIAARANLGLGNLSTRNDAPENNMTFARKNGTWVETLERAQNFLDVENKTFARHNLGIVSDIMTLPDPPSDGVVRGIKDKNWARALDPINNLSDVISVPESRTNLGLGPVAAQTTLPVELGYAVTGEEMELEPLNPDPASYFIIPSEFYINRIKATLSKASQGNNGGVFAEIKANGLNLRQFIDGSSDLPEIQIIQNSQFYDIIFNTPYLLTENAIITTRITQVGNTYEGVGLKIWLMGYKLFNWNS